MTTKLFPPGARVLIDGRDAATVRQAFPEGSTSYAFPHYRLDVEHGDRNIAVAVDRIGVTPRCSGCGTTDHGDDVRCPNAPEDDGSWMSEDDGPIHGYDY
jgi:hypothetical protein